MLLEILEGVGRPAKSVCHGYAKKTSTESYAKRVTVEYRMSRVKAMTDVEYPTCDTQKPRHDLI